MFKSSVALKNNRHNYPTPAFRFIAGRAFDQGNTVTQHTRDTEPCKLLPMPQKVVFNGKADENSATAAHKIAGPVRFTASAEDVATILLNEWQAECSAAIARGDALAADEAAAPFSFVIGNAAKSACDLPDHLEGYSLDTTSSGVLAAANSKAGLLYAWQTLKQLMRQYDDALPAVSISDWPSLDWRIYHVDLKGTRRTLENLHAILPKLSELKINAVLVEYEDYIKLNCRPDIAIEEALTRDEVRAWIEAAKAYNVHVIPLVQTLGHLQYVLEKPQYAYLRERPDVISDACPSHPDTWALVKDFLDEIIDLHPDAPFLHAGLDEAHVAGSCDRCKEAHPDKQKIDIFMDWFNKVCRYVDARGVKPLAWGDMITSSLSKERIKAVDPCVTLTDWSYLEDAPTQPTVARFKGSHVSAEWFRRPNGPVNQLPVVNFGPGMGTIEGLPEDDRAIIEPWLQNDDYPKYVRTLPGQRMLASHGLRTMGASGVRVSFHGQVAPRYITGQLNTLQWAQVCRETQSPGLIATSWSRGHSQAGMNAHPEQDWYGLATLADAGWGNLTFDGLRDFDARFGFQFFGLPDGEIGDLYFQFERTSPRMQIPMASYVERIEARLKVLRPLVKRNRSCFELFASSTEVLGVRHRAAFVLLELEYFHAMWDRVDKDFRARIFRDLEGVLSDIERLREKLRDQYSKSVINRDASELVETQLRWSESQLKLNLSLK